MKRITIVVLLLLSTCAYAQKETEYKASNGKTYKIGDTIKLGRGSGQNETFLYLQLGGWAGALTYNASAGPDQGNIGRNYAGMNVFLKKIKTIKSKSGNKVYFVVSGASISNFNLYIEDAITTCEITDCKNPPVSVSTDPLEKIKKLKELLDAGAITQSEYDSQKKKLLEL